MERKICEACGGVFTRNPKVALAQFAGRRFCSRKCVVRKRKPDSELQAPYRQTKHDGRRVDLHRAIVEDAVGYRLRRLELVHHKDENKLNNSPENLEIMTPKDHSILHNQKHPLTKTCVSCGVEFTPHPTKRARAKCCSKQCALKHLSVTNRKPDAPNSMYRDGAYPSQKRNRK